MPTPRSVIVVVLLSLPACAVARQVASPDAIRERYHKLHEKFLGQAEQIIHKLEADGQSDDAGQVRKLITPVETELISIPILPTNGGAAASDSATSGKAEWQLALTRARKIHARELFDLASAAWRAGDVTMCYDLMRVVIEQDPDHAQARGLMGFTRYGKEWVTPFAAARLRSGQFWHDKYGWISKTQAAHYENGDQLWKGQWLPAEEVAKYRQKWANAWEIDTEHYAIRTNTSLERGVQFAEKLEKLYAIFFRLYAGFFSPREQAEMLFEPASRRTAAGKSAAQARPSKRFRVHFHKDRDEYIDALPPHVRSGAGVTTGMYFTGTSTAYFYVHREMDESTVIHEATHQLFSESRESRQGEGSRGNYWVMEGIAGYMESFADRGDRVELGSWDTPRLKRGREWIMAGKYVPVDKLVRMDAKDFDGPDAYSLYAQSACLCHFLMHHDQGRFRAALVKYLEEVYMGRADHTTLADLTGAEYAELDRLFRAHVTGAKYR